MGGCVHNRDRGPSLRERRIARRGQEGAMERREESRFRAGRAVAAAAFAVTAMASTTAAAGTPFTAFESGQVRPLALTPAGNRLIAVNTPDNRIEVYGVQNKNLTPLGSVQVGLEPV